MDDNLPSLKPSSGFSNRSQFLTDSLVLSGSRVYHIETPNPVWEFDLDSKSQLLVDRDRSWLLTTEALIPIQLLNDQRLREVDKVIQQINNPHILKRGTRVALDVDFRHMGGQADKAKAILLKRLQDIGAIVDSTATLQLRADARRYRSTKLTVSRSINGKSDRSTAEVAPLAYDLMLVDGNRVVWRTHQTPSRTKSVAGAETAQEASDRLSTPRTIISIYAAFFWVRTESVMKVPQRSANL